MNQLKVGLFLAIGIFILVFSIIILGSNKSLFTNSARLVAFFDSIQGLNKGSIVSLAGVRIGNVEKVDFDEVRNLVKVTFLVDQQYIQKIKSDSKIELRTQGALGDKFLYITPGLEGAFVQDQAEIKAEYGNDILSVLSRRGNESERLFDVLAEFQKLMQGLNAQNKIPNLINKLDLAAGNLNDSAALVKKSLASGKLDNSMEKMDRIMSKIDSGQGTLGALINDRTIHDRLKSILGTGQKQQQVKSILKSSIEE